MKKIALMLVFILVLSFALVACGDKTETSSQPAESSQPVSETPSEEPSEQPSEEPSEEPSEQPSEEPSEEPAESSEEPVESSEEPVEPSTEDSSEAPVSGDTNVAAGKSYTVSGSGTGLIISAGEWPCHYDANLTDGVYVNEVSYAADDWFSVSPNNGDGGTNSPDGLCTIVIDLGSSTSVKKTRLHMLNPGTSGIGAPDEITAYISTDGTNYTKVGSQSDFEVSDEAYWVEFSFSAKKAKFVKYTFAVSAAHNFINEIEVIG